MAVTIAQCVISDTSFKFVYKSYLRFTKNGLVDGKCHE